MKFLIIIILIFYILIKTSKYLLRGLAWLMGEQIRKQTGNNHSPYQGGKRRKEGEIEVQYKSSEKGRKTKDFRGGEYVDYEEVDK